MKQTTSIRLDDRQRQKLRQLSQTLGVSPNAIVGQLVDNAQIVPITLPQAVATLTAKNNRYDATNLTGSSVTAVSA